MVHIGALLIAIGSSAQAMRFLWITMHDLRRRHRVAVRRSDRVAIEREARLIGHLDWSVWCVICAGAWTLFVAGVTD